jgi:putative endonuclease
VSNFSIFDGGIPNGFSHEGPALPVRYPEFKYFYIVASKSRVLYIGSARDLRHRLFEHKNGLRDGFSKKYRCTRLVYFERFVTMSGAFDREREVKGWRREKKIELIQSTNPTWEDLAATWFDQEAGPSSGC